MKDFYRDRENRLFLGVVSGLHKYFNSPFELRTVRIIVTILAIITNGLFIALYLCIALFTEMK
ncbi:MAG: PspC domain-containing protein [Lachnospirales bacterium]